MTATTTERNPDTRPPVLRIVRGLHRRAQRRCEAGGLLVIGRADDCDVILSDEAVQAHHAVIGGGPDAWSLRALDGPLQVGERVLEPGDALVLDPFEAVVLGTAAFAVGNDGDARWDALDDYQPPSAGVSRSAWRRHRLALVAIGLTASVATAIAAVSLQPAPPPPAPSPRAVLESSVRGVALEQAQIGEDAGGRLRVVGIAPDQPRIEQLRSELAAHGVRAEVDVRSGSDIANDVAEVLRLSNLPAKAEYRGNGEVGISGHFGDGKALDAVLASRAVRDIRGLSRFAVFNLDDGNRPTPPPTTGDDARRIVVAVGGNDPYVVMGDGARYFIGAELPCGGVLHAIEGQQVLVTVDGTVRPAACSGATAAVKSTNQGEPAVAVPAESAAAPRG
ncbi:MAG TPA: FHA domain-containing protein [Dokdonella sp.]|uniref:FHA domain-containing protein n=1 Tax=Dokdonella sp. TaxID=2291710 RepID=UPI0025B7C6B4|nr:FHA domain-containing protein [Dokdonella sp.]MBX3691607.1 hypothetical protein [Dokdonella sp.]MCW5567886.1 hypothetical protein [Dokdonella sp.]HNR90883.1 FHA domain-containing protein [Dokdonella sp.]